MDLTLAKEGFIVMIIGMGTVYIFLTIMIWAMNISSCVLKILGKYFPEEILSDKTAKKKNSINNDDEIALAVACAVNQARRA